MNCETLGCEGEGVSYNDDGEYLCEDCLFEWYINEQSDDE